MTILLKLLLAHIIGDFLLQPAGWVTEKEAKKAASPKLYLHILIHGVVSMLLLWNLELWPLVCIVMVLHGLIDLVKLYAQTKSTRIAWFVTDQALHLLSILFTWYYGTDVLLNASALWSDPQLWLYVTAVAFLTMASGVVMRVILTRWSSKIGKNRAVLLKDAGRYIGMLERLFVFGFVVLDHWEGVGFLLAAKSVFRFGELKEAGDRNLTEYILIGTLASFGMAMLTGLVVVKLSAMMRNGFPVTL